jgi:hypothetical protein
MDALMLFRSCALLQAVVVILCDLKHYTPNPRRWHTAYTHWNFVAVAMYFFSRLLLGPVPCLQAAAFANTISVNVGYWGVLYPKGWKHGTVVIEPVGTSKHGGSLLWLIGEWLLTGERMSGATGLQILAPLGFSSAYLAHMLFDHHFIVFPKWEPYGDILAKTKNQLAFAMAPMFYYLSLAWLPAIRTSMATSSLAFLMLILPAFDFIRRATARKIRDAKAIINPMQSLLVSIPVEDDMVARTELQNGTVPRTQSEVQLLLGRERQCPGTPKLAKYNRSCSAVRKMDRSGSWPLLQRAVL